jgi:hypothetical protein
MLGSCYPPISTSYALYAIDEDDGEEFGGIVLIGQPVRLEL